MTDNLAKFAVLLGGPRAMLGWNNYLIVCNEHLLIDPEGEIIPTTSHSLEDLATEAVHHAEAAGEGAQS